MCDSQAEGGERARAGDPSDELRITFADCLGEVGEYTALGELVFGHEDHFGLGIGALIENKMTCHRHGPQPDVRLSQLEDEGPCPVGGLAVPRGKVATVIGAMQDVELHELHGVVHMGRTPTYVPTHGGGEREREAEVAGVSKHARKRARAAAKKAAGDAPSVLFRGCWRRTHDDSDGFFYPEGMGLADWDSKYYYA